MKIAQTPRDSRGGARSARELDWGERGVREGAGRLAKPRDKVRGAKAAISLVAALTRGARAAAAAASGSQPAEEGAEATGGASQPEVPPPPPTLSASELAALLAPLERRIGRRRVLEAWRADELAWSALRLDDEVMRAVAHVVGTAKAVKTLSLARNKISDAGALALARALPHSGQLRVIWLSANLLGDEGIAAIAECLPSLGWLERGNQLAELWLSTNRFGAVGAAALAAVLARLPRLQKLDVRYNSIGDAGAASIAAQLGQIRLGELYLSDCAIGDAGGVAIANALPAATWLRELRLSGNWFGDAAADRSATRFSTSSSSAARHRPLTSSPPRQTTTLLPRAPCSNDGTPTATGSSRCLSSPRASRAHPTCASCSRGGPRRKPTARSEAVTTASKTVLRAACPARGGSTCSIRRMRRMATMSMAMRPTAPTTMMAAAATLSSPTSTSERSLRWRYIIQLLLTVTH